MPYGKSVLSSHILFSEYRGPRIFNELADPAVDPAKDPAADPVKDPVKDPPKDPKDDTEGRISALAAEKKALADELKLLKDAEKQRKDAELAQKGEHEKLAEQYKNESASEKTAREAAEGKLAVYEELAKKQIADSLKGIADAEKRKSAEAMLEGLSTEEQMKRLPSILTLAGGTTGFGNGTPPTNLDQRAIDQKQARYTELLAKTNKTPQEKIETNQLMTELTKLWNEKEAKKAEETKQAA